MEALAQLGRRFALTFLAASLVVSSTSCGSDAPDASSASEAVAVAQVKDNALFYAPVVASWTMANLKPGAMQPTDASPHGALECVAGIVSKLEVTICRYSDATSAEEAAEAMENTLEPGVTRVGAAKGTTAVGVRDGDGVDLRGRVIQSLLDAIGP